jgi:hypothetical protein
MARAIQTPIEGSGPVTKARNCYFEIRDGDYLLGFSE